MGVRTIFREAELMGTKVARQKLETKIENQRRKIVQLQSQLGNAEDICQKQQEEIASLKDEVDYQKRRNKILKGEK